MNKAILIGYLGQDPEIKMFENGTSVANLSVATTEHWVDQSGTRQSKTTWHHCQTFRPALVKVIEQYVKKGAKVAIDGSIGVRDYQKDGEDAKRRHVFINIEQFEMLDKKPETSADHG